jgi:hypothetical protein
MSLTSLAAAEVAVPTPSDPQAPLRLAQRQMMNASDVKILTHAMSPAVMETAHEGVCGRETEVEAVLTSGALDALLEDPTLASQLRELIDTDGGTVYRYDGDIPYGHDWARILMAAHLGDVDLSQDGIILEDIATTKMAEDDRYEEAVEKYTPYLPLFSATVLVVMGLGFIAGIF